MIKPRAIRSHTVSLSITIMMVVIAVASLAALNSAPTWTYFTGTNDQGLRISVGKPVPLPPQDGAVLSGSQTVVGVWERHDSHDKYGVLGTVCITNSGSQATQNLAIWQIVQVRLEDSNHVDYISTPVNRDQKPELLSGESNCYFFSTYFTQISGGLYRSAVRISSDNLVGWAAGSQNCLGVEICPLAPELQNEFWLPEAPNIQSNEKEAVPVAASTPTPPVLPTLPDSPTPRVEFTPAATPTPTPRPEIKPTRTPLPVNFNPCTYPPEYWRSFPDLWSSGDLLVGGEPVSPAAALKILQKTALGDDQLALTQQVIAARLNIATGADPRSVEDVLAKADRWLSAHKTGAPPGGTALAVAARLAVRLDDYNRGYRRHAGCPVPPVEDTPTPAPTLPAPTQIAPTELEIKPSSTPTTESTQPAQPTATPTPQPEPVRTEEPQPTPTFQQERDTPVPPPGSSPTLTPANCRP